MEAPELLYFRCDRLGATLSVDQCRANRALPAKFDGGTDEARRIGTRVRPGPCNACPLALRVESADVPFFTRRELLARREQDLQRTAQRGDLLGVDGPATFLGPAAETLPPDSPMAAIPDDPAEPRRRSAAEQRARPSAGTFRETMSDVSSPSPVHVRDVPPPPRDDRPWARDHDWCPDGEILRLLADQRLTWHELRHCIGDRCTDGTFRARMISLRLRGQLIHDADDTYRLPFDGEHVESSAGRKPVTQQAVLQALAEGPRRGVDIAHSLGITKQAAWQACNKLLQTGRIMRLRHGLYGLPGSRIATAADLLARRAERLEVLRTWLNIRADIPGLRLVDEIRNLDADIARLQDPR